MGSSGGGKKNLVLAAMIFAVAMTFIDMTIVAIAVPSLHRPRRLPGAGEAMARAPAAAAPRGTSASDEPLGWRA
jgi:hypothetical protein